MSMLMKKVFFVNLFVFAICFTAAAQNTYIGFELGYGLYASDSDAVSDDWVSTNMNAALTLGHRIGGLRMETALGLTLPDNDEVDNVELEYSNFNLMLNLYYDFTFGAFAIYPMVGVGWARSVIDINNSDWDSYASTYVVQAGLGARLNIDESQSVDLSLRYLYDGAPNYGFPIGELAADSIHFAIGYKYWF